MKISSCTQTLLGPVRPTGQTGRLLPDRLHRHRPVRPPEHTGQTGPYQFWSSTYAPLFFGKACVLKNTLLNQNCLRAMITNALAIFCAKGDKNYRPCLAFLQVDETICFGLQTFFHGYWLCWLYLHLLLHLLLITHTLQPSLLSVR